MSAAQGAEPDGSNACEQAHPQRAGLGEALGLYALSLVLIWLCTLGAAWSPLVAENLYALVAAIFVGLPMWQLSRRGEDVERFGLVAAPLGRGLLWGLVATLLTLPLFWVGYGLWQTEVLGRRQDVNLDHMRQWPTELQGRPPQVGGSPGVWVWSDDASVRLAIFSQGDSTPDVVITSTLLASARIQGQGELRPDDARPLGEPIAASSEESPQAWRQMPGQSRVWRWKPGPTPGMAELALGLAPRDARLGPGPQSLEHIHVRLIPPQGAMVSDWPLYVGQGARQHSGPIYEAERTHLWLLLWALTHLFFVALPEEYFYRGYLQTRLKLRLDAWRPKGHTMRVKRGLLIPTSWLANLAASLLFALGHVLIPISGVFLVSRLSVFFPSLVFGWLRDRTGSLTASVVYHAACNMMVLAAAVHYTSRP